MAYASVYLKCRPTGEQSNTIDMFFDVGRWFVSFDRPGAKLLTCELEHKERKTKFIINSFGEEPSK